MCVCLFFSVLGFECSVKGHLRLRVWKNKAYSLCERNMRLQGLGHKFVCCDFKGLGLDFRNSDSAGETVRAKRLKGFGQRLWLNPF